MHTSFRTIVIIAGAAFATLPGCARSKVAQTLDSTFAAKTEEADLDFWHSLPGRSAVTNSEGLHGVLLLSDGGDPTTTWEERLALLKDRGWIGADFEQAGDETISRGTLAKALCHALDIKGGVMMRLTRTMPRYAIRELAYVRPQIMSASTENQVVNGLDYIGIMSKAQDYLMLRETKKAREALEAQPAAEPAPEEPAPAEHPVAGPSQGS